MPRQPDWNDRKRGRFQVRQQKAGNLAQILAYPLREFRAARGARSGQTQARLETQVSHGTTHTANSVDALAAAELPAWARRASFWM